MTYLSCQGLDSSAAHKDKKGKERRSRALRKELKKVRLDLHILQQKAHVLEKRKDYLVEELKKTSGVLRPSQEPMPGCGDELLGRLFAQEEEVQEIASQEEKEGEEDPLVRKGRTQPRETVGECDSNCGKGMLRGGHIWRAQLDDNLCYETHSILCHEQGPQPPHNQNPRVVDLSKDSEEEEREQGETKSSIDAEVKMDEHKICKERIAVPEGHQTPSVQPSLNPETTLDFELLPSTLRPFPTTSQVLQSPNSGVLFETDDIEINLKHSIKEDSDAPLRTEVEEFESKEKGVNGPSSLLNDDDDPWKASVVATIRAEPLLYEQVLCLEGVRLKLVENVLQANGVHIGRSMDDELPPLLRKLGVRLLE